TFFTLETSLYHSFLRTHLLRAHFSHRYISLIERFTATSPPLCLCKLQLAYQIRNRDDHFKQPYPAMYSSVYGGIILDPAMMVIPIDYHMVHRGHGVFDTSIIFDGIKVQERHSEIWLSAGPENFLLSPAKCSTSAFYVVVIDEDFAQCKEGKWQRPSADRTCKNHFKHNLHCQFSPMHNQPHHSRFR
ncbi:hypothetical protein H5410_026621, partial [Solanum commersonii]